MHSGEHDILGSGARIFAQGDSCNDAPAVEGRIARARNLIQSASDTVHQRQGKPDGVAASAPALVSVSSAVLSVPAASVEPEALSSPASALSPCVAVLDDMEESDFQDILECQTAAQAQGAAEEANALSGETAPAASQQAPARSNWAKVGDFVFYLALILLIVGAFVLFGGSSGGPRMIAGYSAFTVTTGSMQDELPQGSLIVTKQVDPASLQVGDDITYMISESSSITHRIIRIEENYEPTGGLAFETQGIMNDKPDANLVSAVNVVGKVVFCSYPLGVAVGFVQANWPLLIFLSVVAGGLVLVLRRILR